MTSVEYRLGRAISVSSVREDGPLTVPRSFGVYRVPGTGTGRRYRFGNHPVRMWELQREFGSCVLMHLFADREDAKEVASALSRCGA